MLHHLKIDESSLLSPRPLHSILSMEQNLHARSWCEGDAANSKSCYGSFPYCSFMDSLPWAFQKILPTILNMEHFALIWKFVLC